MRFGYTPDMVDRWPVAWAMGWLLERTMELEHDPEKWKGQPVGFGLDDPDYDPELEAFLDALPDPPAGYEEVSDGE